MSDPTVLHVATLDDVGERLRSALSASTAFDLRACETVAEAERKLRDDGVDCLVAACELPDGSGTDLIATARERSPDVGCVLYGEERPDLRDADAETCLTEFVPTASDSAIDRVVSLVEVTACDRTQTNYPLPDAERERLAALDRYDLEDEALLPDLQDVVDHAAEELDVAQATINVVGADEQRFAVCHDEDWAPIPRQDSICTYSILDDEPTVVEDTAVDPRFEDNELLDRIGVRAYAGAPIEPEPDRPIATLCVYDEQPEGFDASEAAYLQALARDAAALIAEGEVSDR